MASAGWCAPSESLYAEPERSQFRELIALLGWCEVDDCPAAICFGPHAEHPEDDKHPGAVAGCVGGICPFCGEVF